MPGYLQRVVASGARTGPTARPPLAIAPPLPALARPAVPSIDVPLDPEAALTRVDQPPHPGGMVSPTSPSPGHPVPAIDRRPPEAGRSPGIGASGTARVIGRAEEATGPDAPTRAGTGAKAPARSDEPAGPRSDELPGPHERGGPGRAGSAGEPGGRGGAVIRAPRGLRADAGTPVDALEMAATLQSVMSRAPAPVSPPRSHRGAPETPASRVDASPRGSAAPPMPREPLPASSRDLVPGGDESVRSGHHRAGVEAAADSPSGPGVAREQPVHHEPVAGSPLRATSVDASAWLLPAPPAARVPVAPRAHERAPRITIGRIDVEVHNEPPAAPPPAPAGRVDAGRVDTSSRSARVASRFLLKP